MGGRRRRVIGALSAGAVPLLLGQGVAAAAFAEGEQSLTFTYQGQEVICRLFGQSDVLDGDASAASSTNADQDPRCAGRLTVQVTYVDEAGVRRTSGSTTATGSDVSHAVQGVHDSFSATHAVRFLNCDDPTDPSACELSFATTPK
jgi:hypothetical protein